jgi:homoserine/homoserine lactone efflux protein
MSLEAWAALAGIWVLAVATPGPNVAFTVATGLSTPRPTAFLAALGIGLGSVVYALLALSGLGVLLYASPMAFAVVRWIGVAYLAWLGLRALRPPTAPAAEAPAPARRWLVARGFAITMANPKSVLAVAAILPPFLDASRPVAPQMAVMAATLGAGSLLVHMLYIWLAARVAGSRFVQTRPRLVRGLVGAIYLGAAAALALFGA